MVTRLRIATRGSQLALWQAHAVRDALQGTHPGLGVDVKVIHTTGDRVLDVPLSRIGDKGLFTKELDLALLRGEADLAVHSLKDVPTRLPDGLALAAVTRREDPRDVLLLPAGRGGSLADLPAGARVGTSSLRRRAQLRAIRPDLEVVDLRGNLNTRLARLDAGDFDAIILAAAGVRRLGWEDRIACALEPPEWLPAVGQGALAIVCRRDDAPTQSLLAPLHDPSTAACVAAERAFLAALEGGCQIPIGALGVLEGDRLVLNGLVADLDGDPVLRDQIAGAAAEAVQLGMRLADRLAAVGATEILDGIRARVAPGVPAP